MVRNFTPLAPDQLILWVFFSICFEQSYEFDTLENLWRITEGVAQMLFDRISKRIQTISMSIMSQVLE